MPQRFSHILKIFFALQVEKFWEVRARKRRLKIIAHSWSEAFLG